MNETELCIIGAILFDAKEAFERTSATKLRGYHFENHTLATIYDWAEKQIGLGIPVDTITVDKALGVDRNILFEAMDAHVTMTHVKHHAEEGTLFVTLGRGVRAADVADDGGHRLPGDHRADPRRPLRQ